MTFQEFLNSIQTIRIEESRAQTNEYFEAVIAKEGLDALHKILAQYFGPPIKPEGSAPSLKVKYIAAPYGGIRKEQTMYFHKTGDHAECALLWPWGSGARITIKVSQSKEAGSERSFSRFFKKLFSFKF